MISAIVLQKNVEVVLTTPTFIIEPIVEKGGKGDGSLFHKLNMIEIKKSYRTLKDIL